MPKINNCAQQTCRRLCYVGGTCSDVFDDANQILDASVYTAGRWIGCTMDALLSVNSLQCGRDERDTLHSHVTQETMPMNTIS